MQLFYEIFPVFLFFLAFKFYDIYVATVVGIVTTFLQVMITRVRQGRWDKKQLITLAVFVLFGGMTLYFHDPIFIKWKPTIIFGVFSLIIIGSQVLTKKPVMQRLMENMLQGEGVIPQMIWNRLNIIWAVFFFMLAAVNLYVAYHLSNDAWVNFKFYGITSMLIALSFFQAFYLMRFMPENRINVMRSRLQKAFSPSQLDVVDESDEHIGHAGHQGGGRHFSITIAAGCFDKMSLVDAHRQIYSLFDDMMPDKIHALKIKVVPTKASH
jgi:intracellular septation protein